MHVLPVVDIERLFVEFVSDTVPASLSDHHLGTPHVIVKGVLTLWFERLLIYHVILNK